MMQTTKAARVSFPLVSAGDTFSRVLYTIGSGERIERSTRVVGRERRRLDVRVREIIILCARVCKRLLRGSSVWSMHYPAVVERREAD